MGQQDVVQIFDLPLSDSTSSDYPILTFDPHPHSLSASFSVPHAFSTYHDGPAIDYNALCATLLAHARRRELFQTIEELADELSRVALERVPEVVVTVQKTRESGLPHTVGLAAHRRSDGGEAQDTVLIWGMELNVAVGLHEWENNARGVVSVDVELVCSAWTGGAGFETSGLVDALYEEARTSDALALEGLAQDIARTALGHSSSSQEATVSLSKFDAVPSAARVVVEITRTAAHFATPKPTRPVSAVIETPVDIMQSSTRHTVAIALGANLGDRYANIKGALQELEARPEVITVTGTSFLYESPPMYVCDQPTFLNCVITAETTLSPPDLLELLKHIETLVGRVAGLRNGPRAVDLDIIFYDALVLDTRTDGGDGSKPGELVIPHMRLAEREFVLRPLHDLLPDHVHPVLKTSVRSLLSTHPKPSVLRKVLPFPAPPGHPHLPSLLWPLAPAPRTYIMAVLNATPDSFSSTPADTDAAVAAGLAAAAAGADILDVGGYSTRPGAARVSPDEEVRRVVPVVCGLRARGVALPISVDTFRPAILRAAVAAGANCLNDVAALAGDADDADDSEGECEDMATVVRALGVPVIMMHSRGAHRAGVDKDYGARGTFAGVQAELGDSVSHALRAGIRRWNVLVDPGFGFSKTTEGNLELLRGLRALTAEGDDANPLQGFPMLAGLSRKSFLGALLEREAPPGDREWATGAAVAAAIQQGVDIVRVHDVNTMRDVVKIADAMWRDTTQNVK